MKKIISPIIILLVIFTLTGCENEKKSDKNSNINDNLNVDLDESINDEEYSMEFTDKEFGTYTFTYDDDTDTVKIFKDGNKIHVIGEIDNYTFDFAFNLKDRFAVGDTKKFNVYYQYDENYTSSISFDELDDEGNSKAYTNLSINNGSLVAAGYGQETTTSTILYK